jgi:hypothetical protein
VSADSVVPGAGKPQALNRYAYVFNNPLKYTDPSGHCSGKPDGPDADCWAMIREIEGNYKNVHIAPDRWTTDELSMLLQALAGHIFGKEIAKITLPITFVRKDKNDNDDLGLTLPTNFDEIDQQWELSTGYPPIPATGVTVNIYNRAWWGPVDGNSSGNWWWSSSSFQATIYHELTHVAVTYGDRGIIGKIFQSFESARGGRDLTRREVRNNLPIGKAYNGGSGCGIRCMSGEYIAMTVAADALQPSLIQNTWLGKWINSLKRAETISGPR